MSRDVPVALADPHVPVQNADVWKELGRVSKVNPNFEPVEIKAFYVIGLMEDFCSSVEWLLRADDAWPDKYLPAFSLFASAVDLLGRCVTGNDQPEVQRNLIAGFH